MKMPTPVAMSRLALHCRQPLLSFYKPLVVPSSLRFNHSHASGTSKSSSEASPPRPTTIPNTPIKIFHSIPPLRQWRRNLFDHRPLALVPTMGALHAGHLALIREAARHSNVIISIYINPSQFGVNEDLSTYPKTWEQDLEMLRDLDRDMADSGENFGRIVAVFAPGNEDMYPSGFPNQDYRGTGSFVTITPLAHMLEGKSRPTFFRGVATVCMKLFNIVQPEKVYFGQKDIQQTVVIKKMVKDFRMDTEVVVCDTVREADGLAMSSRNVYLGTRRRKVALTLNEALLAASNAYAMEDIYKTDQIVGRAQSVLDKVQLRQKTLKPSERSLFEVDYLALVDPETMEHVYVVDKSKGAVLCGAITMFPVEKAVDGEDLGAEGGPAVRLIDNLILKPKV